MAKSPKKSTKGQRVTPRQQRFVKNYADPNSPTFSNQTQSYRMAYPNANYNTAGVKATGLMSKPQIRQAVVEYGKLRGLTPETVIDTFSDKLKATTKKWNMQTRTYEDAPAHEVQLKAAIEGAKLLDLYPDDHPQVQQNVLQMTAYLYGMSEEEKS